MSLHLWFERGDLAEPGFHGLAKQHSHGYMGTLLPSVIFTAIENWWKRKLRQPGRGDDTDHQVLASIQPRNH